MYRGEIQNDSNGGSLYRSLAFSPSNSGGGGNDRFERRNLSVGAGIGRCEEEEYNCCGLYGRGENEQMEDDPCWEGYEMIGTKMKKGREVPNCVPVKGEGFWDDVRKGLVKHNERKKSKPISEEEWKKQMEDFKAPTEAWGADELEGGVMTQQKLDRVGMTIRHLSANRGEQLNEEVAKFSLAQLAELEEVIEYFLPKPHIGADTKEFYRELLPVIKREIQAKTVEMSGKGDAPPAGAIEVPNMENFIRLFSLGNKDTATKLDNAIYGNGKSFTKAQLTKIILDKNKVIADLEENAYGGADVPYSVEGHKQVLRNMGYSEQDIAELVPQMGGAEATPPSGIGAVADALQPVRTAIQNKVGDLIYGAETDPRKQRKGLLGISEEGKEESKKKVIKNIVVPVVTFFNDTWDSVFDPEKLKNRREAESAEKGRRAGIESAERDGYVYKTPDGKYTYEAYNKDTKARNEVIRKPRVAKRWVQKNAKYNTGYWSYDMEGKAQGFSPYIEIPNPIKEAGVYYTVDDLKKNNIPFFIPVDRLSTQPQAENEEKWRGGFEGDKLWVPEDKAREIFQSLNQYKAKIEEEKERKYYESLTEVEKKEYRERKALERDTGMTEAAKAKVAKDIADEEAKENPDTERLAKMKAAQERVRVKGVDNFWKGQTQGKQVAERIYNDQMTKDVAERQAANEQEQADATATFKAMTPAERSAQIDAYRKDLQEQGFSEESIEDMVSQIGEQGVVAVGGAGSDDEDEDEKEEIEIIEVVLSKMERYFVDAPPKNEKGERVGLPLGTYKRAISDLLGIGCRRVYDPETEDEIGILRDPIWKKVAMKVMKMEKGWRDENLKKLGFTMEEGSDGEEHITLIRDGELVGEGAIEFTLEKAGKALFNPTGNMTMVGKQTFTPDYDAYGATIEQGRKNAFNLSRSMYNQQQAIDVDGFQLIEDDTSLRFYLKDDEDVIMVGIRGTDVKSWTDLYTWAVIGAKQDFRMTTRFQDDLQKLLRFQKEYSLQEFYYVGVGSSLAGSIADRFLDMGLLNEAITYNPSIEKKYILDSDIHNHRVYLDTDPLFMLMGQYAPNTEIRKNAGRANFFNPSKEKDYLIASHSIFPVYNPAFEGGGMMGAGKTYTIEEWKAIFDAKLEQKRQQIEAREAKKKQTAKAKRERAKARRDGRDEPPPLETPATFRTSRVMKATPPREPEPAPPAPKKRKPRLKVVAPASARVELREELVAEQPREPSGEFAQEAEPLQLVVAEIERQPQRAYMKLMKSPMLTEADRQLMMNLQRSNMAPMRKVKLLARSGLARKVMEILGIDESAFQSQRARARIADTMEKRVEPTKVRDVMALKPIMDLFDKQEAGLIRFCATKTKFADVGTLHNFITSVAPKFARCAVGAWVVTEKLFASGGEGGLKSYNCDGRNEPLTIDGVRTESYGGNFSRELTMNLTGKEEDDNVTSIGFFKEEPLFGLNFASPDKKGQNFFFSQMAEACMKMVEKIDGIQEIRHFVRGSGFGRKRQAVWNVLFDEIVERVVEPKPKPAVRQKIAQDEARKVRNEIAPKVKALIVEFKDDILARGDLMIERVIASLTPAQKGMFEAEVERIEKSKSKPEQIKSKKKRLEEVEAQLGVIERMDSSMMRRYLMPDVVAREDKIAAKAPSLRAERDKLKREIAALEK